MRLINAAHHAADGQNAGIGFLANLSFSSQNRFKTHFWIRIGINIKQLMRLGYAEE
jgi:hypothetical protein